MAFLYAIGKYALITGGVGYVSLLAAVVGLQRRLIWMRPPVAARPETGSLMFLSVDQSKKLLIPVLYFAPSRPEMPTLVHFHGNADQIGWGPQWLGQVLSSNYGLGFLAVEYPSYGLSEAPVVSEVAIYESAQAAIRFLVAEEGLNTPLSKVVLVGESIGCGVAIEMAKRRLGSKLVLMAPFYSLRDLVLQILPRYLTWPVALVPGLLWDKFANDEKVPTVGVPVLIVHGDHDEVIPISQSRRLASLVPSTKYLTVTGAGHNNLFDAPVETVVQTIVDFVLSDG